MSWSTADYLSYPARCSRFHREAIANLGTPLLLGTWPTELEAASEAELHRKFRYLVRSQPGKDFAMDRLFSTHKFRTRRAFNAFGDCSLYLIALPKPALELEAQLPSLTRILS